MVTKTQIAAIATAAINFGVTLMAQLNILVLAPETVSSLNGFLIPIIMLFLGDKIDRTEIKAKETAATVNRIEAAQPETSLTSSIGPQSATSSSSSTSTSNGRKETVTTIEEVTKP